MQIHINNLIVHAKLIPPQERKHPNMRAFVSVVQREDEKHILTITGFTLWISKHGGYNLEVPQKPRFKFCILDSQLLQRIKQEAVSQIQPYDSDDIPVVEDEKINIKDIPF